MKRFKLILLFLLSIATSAGAQQLNDIKDIGNFSEDLIAISKNDSWGFIDANGTLVIDFRKDIVGSSKKPPIFSDGLCLIKEKREDIYYYGYMDKKGKTIITPEYIVATPFKNGFASVINYYKTDTGKNVFSQNVVYYSYKELIINTKNKSILYINDPHNLLLSKLKLQENIPTIRSKFIGKHLISVHEDDHTYSIYNLNN
jgi:hypothetical protein